VKLVRNVKVQYEDCFNFMAGRGPQSYI